MQLRVLMITCRCQDVPSRRKSGWRAETDCRLQSGATGWVSVLISGQSRGKGVEGRNRNGACGTLPRVCAYETASCGACYSDSGPSGRFLAISRLASSPSTLSTMPERHTHLQQGVAARGQLWALEQLGEYPAPIRGREQARRAEDILAMAMHHVAALNHQPVEPSSFVNSDSTPKSSLSPYRCLPSA
jgi:hypothetical protein